MRRRDDVVKKCVVCMCMVIQAALGLAVAETLLIPANWNPQIAADKVLQGLFSVNGPDVKGAHDAELAIVGDKAYIVAEYNDLKPGHGTGQEYVALSIVDIPSLTLERFIPFARAGQTFENEILPDGYCFVPRIIQKDDRTLRCYFASHPRGQEGQTWIIDFDLKERVFANRIERAKLKTSEGVFDLQPRHFHADAARHGFTKKAAVHGLYLFDSFKVFDGKTYIAINNFPVGQNALACVNAGLDTFEIIGHYNEPQGLRITESAVNRLPDGTWMAICRQDGGNNNYLFTTSKDGRDWAVCEHRDVVRTGLNAKPTFDRFKGVYYLGWQDNARVNGTGRTVFNVDVSLDGKTWVRKYRFETADCFCYPTFREHRGAVYLTATQGQYSGERIMFGKLE